MKITPTSIRWQERWSETRIRAAGAEGNGQEKGTTFKQ
uniref:Uncharacterized protein n=1 Tax=Rhizophora mucronata TaxID=61149 RepID=A0A2P2NST8_RHIMU